MAKDDLAVIRDQYAAVNERDFERVMAHYAEDVELLVPAGGINPINPGTFKGRDAVGRWFGDWFTSFDATLRFEIRELKELENGAVLLVADNYGRGRSSGVEVQWEVVWTYRLRDRKVVRLEAHASRDAALRAAGMEP